jgi:hypothetical protein
MGATYFVAIVAICVVPSLLALVAYVVRRIGPCSFRLSVALTRIFSFSVEMESRGRDAKVAIGSAESRHRARHRIT